MVYEGTSTSSMTAAPPSPSTRRPASRGSRCTSTWSPTAPSTTRILTTTDDRVGLLLFSAGQAAVLRRPARTSPARSRPTTRPSTRTSRWQPAPVGKSGVLGKGLMSISVNKATKFPNASMALAQFFTNPRSMVQFAKQVAVYPSSAVAYDDPFFTETPANDRGQRPAAGRGHHRDLPGHRPDDPEEGGRQRASFSRRSSRRCSTRSPPSRRSTTPSPPPTSSSHRRSVS